MSFFILRGQKEDIWLSPMTKAPTPAEMSKGQSENTNNVTKKVDYTADADRPWSNYGLPNGVVNRFTGPTFPYPQQTCNQKDKYFKICKLTSLYRQQTNNSIHTSIGDKYYISKIYIVTSE